MDTELEEILDDHFLDDHETLDADRLRAMRTRCRELETSLSYLRRLAQARIDMVTAELDRREAGGDSAGVNDLLERLPTVLADQPSSGPAGPIPSHLAPGPVEGTLADELAEMEAASHLDELSTVPAERLETTRDRLDDYERRVSELRRALFERVDTLGAVLGRRYRDGEVDIATVITEA